MFKITLPQLESHLWESANILRGSIDSADYKNYIFGLLFLKRLHDVFSEAEQHPRSAEMASAMATNTLGTLTCLSSRKTRAGTDCRR